ncbi:hypothetical protein Pla123a_42770 [Posidoniimonas polymericola]|uniref:Bacterial extracellular solute-binding protein n=1 Tax=Posidoniimonas polymericola TaxID=2528002 RepID=A0A5C5XYV0_9BACT|nr:hypothetical protein Pla123a_42770 [Posidoniimonas polymericola]
MLVLAAGCPRPQADKPKPADAGHPRPSAASVTLTIGVGDDPQLAAAIELLAGEWREVSGGRFEVRPLEDGGATADLIVFSPLALGGLCDAGTLRPVRDSALRSDALAVEDLYPAVREQLISYGGRLMALPLGCVTPLAVSQGEGEVRWAEVAQAGPLRPAWRLLAQAAPLAVHELRESVLFDPESMAPKITSEPFVAALEALVAAPPADQAPAQLVVPSRPAEAVAGTAKGVRVSPLPGASRFYHPVRNEWITVNGAPRRVSLVGVDGRLVGVTAASRNGAAAFKLAAWLAGKSNARQLAQASRHVANVRRSLSRLPDDWQGQGAAGLGREFAAALDAAWQNKLRLVAPRLIEVERYLVALDDAVQQAIDGQSEPLDALRQAADRWDTLTDEVGRQRQRSCYLRHLGVEQYEPPKR